jgi:ketosteroid isomerase-like protein
MEPHVGLSRNIETVNTYLDGFRKNDHEQILSCLTDDIEWTVFGAFHVTGKEAYDKAIDGAPEFIDPPELEVVRMVEQGDVIMAELTGTAKRTIGGEMRMSMAEVFVMRDGDASSVNVLHRMTPIHSSGDIEGTSYAGVARTVCHARRQGSRPMTGSAVIRVLSCSGVSPRTVRGCWGARWSTASPTRSWPRPCAR